MALCLLAIAGLVNPTLAQNVAGLFRLENATSHFKSGFHQIEIAPGKEFVLADFAGPGKVTSFYISDDTRGHWYPGIVLKVFWDDSADPSIVVPLADFFGAVGGKSVDYASAVMQINENCYTCYLPMPFTKRARFVLANDGDRGWSQKVPYGIDVEEYPAGYEENSRLHCQWRRSNAVKSGVHSLFQATGRGQYVGSILQVKSRDPNIWFGEGDTLLRIDGRPETHTTGTEDEYGSCWAAPNWKTYAHPYCGHPLNEDGVNRMYRWYVANPIRFRESIRVEIQNQHDNVHPAPDDESDDYTSIAFWYQEGPHRVETLPTFKERMRKSFTAGN